MNGIDEFYKNALDIVQQAGKILKHGFYSAKDISTKLNENDFVTEYDKLIEKTIIDSLLKLYPNHKFIAEESAAQNILTNEPTWILDPIDGTTNFINKFPFCCISLALAVEYDLQIGIVYNPILDQLFTAQKGKGAFMNNNKIHVNSTNDLKKAMVGFDIYCSVDEQIKQFFLKKCEEIMKTCRGIRSLGSAAMQLSYLAMGAIDVCPEMRYLKCWDVVAGILLIQEAGGIVLDSEGHIYKNIMDANIIPACTRKLAEDIKNLK
ncbi:uncharacterized protein LOC126903456 isoform X2 [Daktulosphaira vitifoliae]|uniref:uncharacterized protein LOC126903456 isoform X2 n=1 Tax=Daktulosphaira vitifoliae TaxID=58002 RepID=UPI0021AA121B|nr:uncharacterized protein LOC126903456 isoform X2 [Daktulosphaira vitifoliae]